MMMKHTDCRRICLTSLIMLMAGIAISCGAPDPEKGTPQTEEAFRTQSLTLTYGGHDYCFINSVKNFDQAVSYCASYGYALVKIDNADEQRFLTRQEQQRNGSSRWWIGLVDRGLEGVWVWPAPGKPLSYANWDTGQPDNGHGNEENCASDNYLGTGRWNDDKCELALPFICEKESSSTSNNGSFAYSVTNTNSATQNTADQTLTLYKDQVFTVGTCGVYGSSGTGDTFLRVLKGSTEIAYSDDTQETTTDGCSPSLSNLSFVVPETGTYIIRAGCFSTGSCKGTVAYTY